LIRDENWKVIKKLEMGFTLIELVMVIVILGILSMVVLPKYVNLKNQANIAALKGTLGAIRATVGLYYTSTAVFGTDASYPSGVTTDLFADSRIPSEPISNKSASTNTFTGQGGWAYFSGGGTVYCNVTTGGWSTY
jgi:prepilin-type N-terminal cleavage/methylation domain-containing protein